MFTYICPKCGREVPPAYSECPDCAAKAAGISTPQLVVREPAPQPAPAETAPPPPQAEEPAKAPAVAAPAYAPPARTPDSPLFAPAPMKTAAVEPASAPAPGWAAPMWLLTILFAFAILGVVLGGVWLASTLRGKGQAVNTVADTQATKTGAATSPLQRYVEISGLRYLEDPKNKAKTIVKFVLTNHSDADLPGVSGTATLLGITPKGAIPEGTFTFTTDLPPGAVKDLSAPLETTKMIYELPDWQKASTDLQITGTGAGSASSPARR